MHLLYPNIAQYMRNHWNGTFTPNINGSSEIAKAIIAEAAKAGREAADTACARGDDENGVKALAKDAKAASKTAAKLRAAREKASKKELYNIPDSDWELIGKEPELLVSPAAFGDRPRSASTFRKAAEWKAWLMVYIAAAVYTSMHWELSLAAVTGPRYCRQCFSRAG